MYHRKKKQVAGFLSTKAVKYQLGVLDGKKDWGNIIVGYRPEPPFVESGKSKAWLKNEVRPMTIAPQIWP